MKLAAHLAYTAGPDQLREQLDVVQACEQYGYDSAWTAEAYGSDAGTPLAWMAGHTEKIRLGAAIFQIPGRTPANCAMTAATIDCISNGRFILGLGSSGPQVAEGWHGQPFAQQIQRTREYIEIVRKALNRERLEYDGQIYKLPLPDGPGKALKLIIKPVQKRIPIFLAAIGPNNTALCGEVADGWLPYLFSPEHVKQLRVPLEEGAARAGRAPSEIEVSPAVFTAIGDDLAQCRDLIRPVLALYVGGMGSRKMNFYNRIVCSYGFEDAAAKVQDLFLDGKHAEAMAALPDELIDMVSLVGTPDMVRDRLVAYKEAGVDNLLVSPMATDLEGRKHNLRLVSELV